MKILTRFFLKELVTNFIITYFVFFTLSLSFDFIEKFDDILRAKINMLDTTLFFIYRSIYLHSEYSNYALLISVVISLNILSQRNELVSLFTSGISMRKIFKTVLKFILFVGLINLFFTLYISPKFLLQAEGKLNKKITAFKEIDDLIFKTSDGFVFIDLIIPTENILLNTYIVNLNNEKKIDNIIFSKKIEKKDNEWTGTDIKKYDISEKKILSLETIKLTKLKDIEGLTPISYKPEWLTLLDILKVIKAGLKSGISLKNYIYTLTKKIFSLFSLLLLFFLMFPLGVQMGRTKKNVEVIFICSIFLAVYSTLETFIFRFSKAFNLFFIYPPVLLTILTIITSLFFWKKYLIWELDKSGPQAKKHQMQ